jgi:hypothetical protein
LIIFIKVVVLKKINLGADQDFMSKFLEGVPTEYRYGAVVASHPCTLGNAIELLKRN